MNVFSAGGGNLAVASANGHQRLSVSVSLLRSELDWRGVHTRLFSPFSLEHIGVLLLFLAVHQIGLNAQITSHPGSTHQMGGSCGNLHDTNGQFCCGGTLGALVSDGTKQYILSNNHVLGLLGASSTGDPISQPGLVDNSCQSGRTVANLTLSLPLSPTATAPQFDAAIAEVIPGELDSSGSILNLGVPGPSPVTPVKNLKVTKMGDATGVTTGTIQQTVANLNIGYSDSCRPNAPTIPLQNLMIIQGDNQTPFSAQGDSGSLIVTTAGHNPVGLLVAGNGTVTAAQPIADVLGALSNSLGKPLSVVSAAQPTSAFRVQAAPVMSPAFQRLIEAKDRLWASVRHDPSVVGVSVTLRPGNANWLEIVVYVRENTNFQSLAERLGGFGIFHPQGTQATNRTTWFLGHRVQIVETAPFMAYGKATSPADGGCSGASPDRPRKQ